MNLFEAIVCTMGVAVAALFAGGLNGSSPHEVLDLITFFTPLGGAVFLGLYVSSKIEKKNEVKG